MSDTGRSSTPVLLCLLATGLAGGPAASAETTDAHLGEGAKCLFIDRGIGHAGRMMLDLSARSWLALLYGADLEKIGYGPYDPADARAVTSEVIDFNRPYRN